MTACKTQQTQSLLLDWYRRSKRELPWRLSRDPYRIWVSEVMLQQTTVVAVIPYYERFLRRFPDLESLASAPIEDVLEHWAGLGYYSRARNLHKAASELQERGGFPQTHEELSKLPGFGPYTSRAVASLAFDQRVGVLDGNVIRVLSRLHGLAEQWWKPQGRARLQALADELAQVETPADLNQGLMELGATVCTPSSPACILCPWASICVARTESRIASLPSKRPRREREIWLWRPTVVVKDDRVMIVPNTYAPFLKGHWILPGQVERLDSPPAKYDYRGAVTHHDIFVSIKSESTKTTKATESRWVPRHSLSKEIPASLVRKAIELSLIKE